VFSLRRTTIFPYSLLSIVNESPSRVRIIPLVSTFCPLVIWANPGDVSRQLSMARLAITLTTRLFTRRCIHPCFPVVQARFRLFMNHSFFRGLWRRFAPGNYTVTLPDALEQRASHSSDGNQLPICNPRPIIRIRSASAYCKKCQKELR